MSRAPELENAFASLNGYSKTAVIDLTGCTFLDSEGIRAIMRACAEHEMSIVCPPGNVHRVLDIVAVGKVVRLHESLEDALAT